MCLKTQNCPKRTLGNRWATRTPLTRIPRCAYFKSDAIIGLSVQYCVRSVAPRAGIETSRSTFDNFQKHWKNANSAVVRAKLHFPSFTRNHFSSPRISTSWATGGQHLFELISTWFADAPTFPRGNCCERREVLATLLDVAVGRFESSKRILSDIAIEASRVPRPPSSSILIYVRLGR